MGLSLTLKHIKELGPGRFEWPSDQNIGWIGAGKMGAQMIRNLLAVGITVAVTKPDRRGVQSPLAGV